MNYSCLSDRELVTELEHLPAFQKEGSAEREAMLRLAHRVSHPVADSDPRFMRKHPNVDSFRYNERR